MASGVELSKLTAADIEAAALKTGAKIGKLNDGGGLHLLIEERGKSWRFRYKNTSGKDALMSLGVFPSVSLTEARAKAAQAREQIARGQDPQAKRQTERNKAIQQAVTFGILAAEFNQSPSRVVMEAKTRERDGRNFNYSKRLHSTACVDLQPSQIIAVCVALQNDGRTDSVHRLKFWIASVIEYARQRGNFPALAPNPAKGKFFDLAPVRETHRAAIVDPLALRKLMLDIDSWMYEVWPKRTTPSVCRALQLQARTALRSGEVASIEWSEVDLTGERHDGHPTIDIPRSKMKMKDPNRDPFHVVPLSTQAAEILKAQHELTGHMRYVFPNRLDDDRHISDGTLPGAMQDMGYRGKAVPNGFRRTFSTLARDMLHARSDAIELQMDHDVGTQVERSYSRAEAFKDRRKLMQDYSDLLERIRDNA